MTISTKPSWGVMRLKRDVKLSSQIPEMARWGLLNCSLAVLRSAGRAAPAEAEPSIEANLGAINRAEDIAEAVECQLGGVEMSFTKFD